MLHCKVAATVFVLYYIANLPKNVNANVGVDASIADTVSGVYKTITGKEKSAGDRATAAVYDVAMGKWMEALQEAKNLARDLGSRRHDNEELKLKAYEQYLNVKHMLQDAYSQALSAEPEDEGKAEIGNAKRKLSSSYDEASSALDSAAVAAKIVIKKLFEKGSEYAGYAKDKTEETVADYGRKANDAYEYAGEKKDEAISIMQKLADAAINYVGGAKDYGVEKTVDAMKSAGQHAKKMYNDMSDLRREQREHNEHHHHDHNSEYHQHHDHDHHSLLYSIDRSMWHLPCFLLALGTIGCAVFAYQAYERYDYQRRRGSASNRRVEETIERTTHPESHSHSRGTDLRCSHGDDDVRRRGVH